MQRTAAIRTRAARREKSHRTCCPPSVGCPQGGKFTYLLTTLVSRVASYRTGGVRLRPRQEGCFCSVFEFGPVPTRPDIPHRPRGAAPLSLVATCKARFVPQLAILLKPYFTLKSSTFHPPRALLTLDPHDRTNQRDGAVLYSISAAPPHSESQSANTSRMRTSRQDHNRDRPGRTAKTVGLRTPAAEASACCPLHHHAAFR
jgi:hypothetical protein